MSYQDFLHSKVVKAPESGFIIHPAELNPALKPRQRDAVGYLKAEEFNIGQPTLFDLIGG